MAQEKTGKMMLSVIMITIPERNREFAELHKKLSGQIFKTSGLHPSLGNVEIVKIITPRYPEGPSIGEKRQMGLEKARGEYVCWLDDDDDIAPDYIETILRLAYDTPDVLTFSNLSQFEHFWTVVRMSLKNETDEQVRPGIVSRRPYHVCGWRRELAKQVSFDAVNKDEDVGFISKLIPLCRTERHSENIIHVYKRITKSYAEALYS